VMPCLDEADTLAVCIDKANRALNENHIAGEIVIADNGSTDGSQEIARDLGVRVVPVSATPAEMSVASLFVHALFWLRLSCVRSFR